MTVDPDELREALGPFSLDDFELDEDGELLGPIERRSAGGVATEMVTFLLQNTAALLVIKEALKERNRRNKEDEEE